MPEKAFIPLSGRAELHTHTNRQAVEAVHQADGKRQIADFFRAKMVEQRQINIIFRVGAGDMSDRFGPCQRRTFLFTEVVAHSPTCQRVEFGLRNACFAQRLTVHFGQNAQPLICETRR